jgi:hypothetical protein
VSPYLRDPPPPFDTPAACGFDKSLVSLPPGHGVGVSYLLSRISCASALSGQVCLQGQILTISGTPTYITSGDFGTMVFYVPVALGWLRDWLGQPCLNLAFEEGE